MSLTSLTIDGPLAILRMQDPKRRNALSAVMLQELVAAFALLDRSVRVLILGASTSETVWCAGFDIAALSPGSDPLDPAGALHGLFRQIRTCPVPVIGMIHGSTWGGGTDLAFRCDLLVADTTACFAFTPARLGLPYDLAGLANAAHRVGPTLAAEMFATAAPISAERALAAGLLNRLVEPAELERATFELALRIADNAPLSVSSAMQHLRAIGAGATLPAAVAAQLASGRQAALQSSDYAEGLAAFGEKRQPTFTGS